MTAEEYVRAVLERNKGQFMITKPAFAEVVAEVAAAMADARREALEEAASFIERACSGSDDENIVDAGPRWVAGIRALLDAGKVTP